MDKLKIGYFLQTLRTERNLTQQDEADIFSLTPQAISKWESGQSIPDVDTLNKLSNFYGVTINEVLDGERSPKATQGQGVTNEVETPLAKRLKARVAPFVASCALMVLTLLCYAFKYVGLYVDYDRSGPVVLATGYEVLSAGIEKPGNLFLFFSLCLTILIFGMGFGVFFSGKKPLAFRLVQHISMWLLLFACFVLLQLSFAYSSGFDLRIGYLLNVIFLVAYIICFYALSQNHRKNLKKTISE